jgi:hypothetical protein
VLAVVLAVLSGCVAPAAAWKGQVEWPDEQSARLVVPAMEAGAALAAAAAIREMIESNPYPHLFAGCASPEQGLDAAVFTGPTPGLYYVVLEERFDRCGGPRGRVLDWWHVYAVTPQGEVVGQSPHPPDEAPAAPLPDKAVETPEPPLPPAATPPAPPEASPSPTPAPASPLPAPPEQ